MSSLYKRIRNGFVTFTTGRNEMALTENELYQYDEGFADAMRFVMRLIESLKEMDTSGKFVLAQLEMQIMTARQSRDDVDSMMRKMLERLDKKAEDE